MAYDERLAKRVRHALRSLDTEERRMFGGLCFLLRGKMCCGIVADRLVVRVGPDEYEAALARPGARPMDFTGRPLRGFVYVEPAALRLARDLATWVRASVSFVQSVRQRKPSSRSARRKKRVKNNS